MMLNYLEFEQPIAELEAKIEELRKVSRNGDFDLGLEEEVNKLKEKSLTLTKKIFASASPSSNASIYTGLPQAYFYRF